MKKRQSLVQQFSTFLSFSGTPATEWITAPELERAIQPQLQDQPEAATETWALHFLSILQTQSRDSAEPSQYLLAEKHLSAYLQEACYQAAQKIQRQFRSVQHQYALEDLFQMGSLIVNQPAKLFRSYQSDYQFSNLESYAKTAIYRFIGNAIYAQDVEAKREKFSDYGLLKDLSTKELKEALTAQGITAVQMDSYCLAQHCYTAVCQPQARHGIQRLAAPNQEELAQITTCYNQQHDCLALLVEKDEVAIQTMLSACIQAARQYRSQRILPIENDELIADSLPTPWDNAFTPKGELLRNALESREQVESWVAEEFRTLPAVGQMLLKLWLGLGLTQTEIATVTQSNYLELQKQYQVARQLGKYKRHLLRTFLQQCQQLNPNLSLEDDQAIASIQASWDECLQVYCQRSLYLDLERLHPQHSHEDRDVIQRFTRQLETDLNLSSESLEFVNEKIADFVFDWMS